MFSKLNLTLYDANMVPTRNLPIAYCLHLSNGPKHYNIYSNHSSHLTLPYSVCYLICPEVSGNTDCIFWTDLYDAALKTGAIFICSVFRSIGVFIPQHII